MENKKVQIAPSLLSADFSRLAEELADIKTAGADMVHIDVMDGHFVDNITIGPPVVAALRKCSDLFFDVHLMIDEPSKYIKAFAEAGADSINFHEETSENKSEVIGLIKSFGAKPALTVKPGTPIERVYPYLDKLYMVLIMTVEPGFGGQAFIRETLPKIKALREKIDAEGLGVFIQVDGGINEATIKEAAANGADIFVAGSAVFGAANRKRAVECLRTAI